jgi:acyl-CoA thioester hydrolase
VSSSTSQIRVRYAETDQMGVAWHGEYFAWFEVGRTDYLRQRGCTYRELEAQGLRLPVIEARAEYRSPAFYDDVLEIHTRITELRGARVAFAYEVHRADAGQPLATGFTCHAALDASGRPRRLPEDLRRLLTTEVDSRQSTGGQAAPGEGERGRRSDRAIPSALPPPPTWGGDGGGGSMTEPGGR